MLSLWYLFGVVVLLIVVLLFEDEDVVWVVDEYGVQLFVGDVVLFQCGDDVVVDVEVMLIWYCYWYQFFGKCVEIVVGVV